MRCRIPNLSWPDDALFFPREHITRLFRTKRSRRFFIKFLGDAFYVIPRSVQPELALSNRATGLTNEDRVHGDVKEQKRERERERDAKGHVLRFSIFTDRQSAVVVHTRKRETERRRGREKERENTSFSIK